MKYIKRLWGIRHIRWLYLDWRVRRYARQWGEIGVGLGVMNPSDADVLDRIWRGEL